MVHCEETYSSDKNKFVISCLLKQKHVVSVYLNRSMLSNEDGKEIEYWHISKYKDHEKNDAQVKVQERTVILATVLMYINTIHESKDSKQNKKVRCNHNIRRAEGMRQSILIVLAVDYTSYSSIFRTTYEI